MSYYKIKLADTCDNISPNRAFSQAYYMWCIEMFGAPFQGKPRKECKWNEMRWYMIGNTFCFKEESDMLWFLLKWC